MRIGSDRSAIILARLSLNTYRANWQPCPSCHTCIYFLSPPTTPTRSALSTVHRRCTVLPLVFFYVSNPRYDYEETPQQRAPPTCYHLGFFNVYSLKKARYDHIGHWEYQAIYGTCPLTAVSSQFVMQPYKTIYCM